MNSILTIRKTATRATVATLLALSGLSATSLAQAEATEFALPTGSTLTRAEVIAETVRAVKSGEIDRRNASYLPSYDAQSTQQPMVSQKTRAEVRAEARMSQPSADSIAASYFVGGM